MYSNCEADDATIFRVGQAPSSSNQSINEPTRAPLTQHRILVTGSLVKAFLGRCESRSQIPNPKPWKTGMHALVTLSVSPRLICPKSVSQHSGERSRGFPCCSLLSVRSTESRLLGYHFSSPFDNGKVAQPTSPFSIYLARLLAMLLLPPWSFLLKIKSSSNRAWLYPKVGFCHQLNQIYR